MGLRGQRSILGWQMGGAYIRDRLDFMDAASL